MNLTELQKADPATYNEIRSIFGAVIVKGELRPKIADDIIQGCLQRAIERRGLAWDGSLAVDEPAPYMAGIYEIGPGYDGDHWTEKHLSCIAERGGNSPAEALLSAYLEALHES